MRLRTVCLSQSRSTTGSSQSLLFVWIATSSFAHKPWTVVAGDFTILSSTSKNCSSIGSMRHARHLRQLSSTVLQALDKHLLSHNAVSAIGNESLKPFNRRAVGLRSERIVHAQL